MVLNPFFQQGSATEQNLVQDLINEQLKIYGIEVYYIPRKYLTEKKVIREVVQSEFNDSYPIEAYVETYDGYEGMGPILSKFGVQQLYDVTLIISQDRWQNYIQPLIDDLDDIKLATRPKEGDLVWFPLGDRLFEIKLVEKEDPFYMLRKTYTYKLKCELFRYEDEVIDTNLETIDDNVQDFGYIQTLQLVGIGTTATAITSLTDGGVQYITIWNDGYNLTDTTVAISSAPSGGRVAVATAFVNPAGGLDKIYINDPGSGYTAAPDIVFNNTTGGGTIATTGIGTTGTIGIVTVTDGGSGYTTTPTVSFTGATGIGVTAEGVAVVSAAGSITAVRITNAGVGYTQIPTITIGAPSVIGTGNYIFNEIIVGTSSSTTARVKEWNVVDKTLEIGIINGTFSDGETIRGTTSGATYTLYVPDTTNQKFDTVEPFNENKILQTEGDSILDFTQRNPFGDP